MWTTVIGTVVGGVLVIAANLVLAYQQSRAAERKYRVELDRALRQEKLLAVRHFTAAARVLETRANDAFRERADLGAEPAVWEAFWDAHSDLDLLLSERSREPLLEFAHKLAGATHNENAEEEVWAYLKPHRIAWRSAVREELNLSI